MPGFPTNFLLWQKPPGRLNGKWGKFTPKWPNSPQKGSLGALVLIHPKLVQSRNFEIVQIRSLIARSKNLAKADLMGPPPELSIFLRPTNRPVSSGLTGWAQLNLMLMLMLLKYLSVYYIYISIHIYMCVCVIYVYIYIYIHIYTYISFYIKGSKKYGLWLGWPCLTKEIWPMAGLAMI
jgi:hypothetical protein